MDQSRTILEPPIALRPLGRGFSLIEVLVVIGLLALLVAILLPAIRYARLAADNAVCTSRLRDLALASMMYRVDHGEYPSPCRYAIAGDIRAFAVPQDVNTRLINNLGQYLKFARINAGTPVTALPHHVQAPWAERTTNGRGPKKATLVAAEPDDFYYTGYIYTADLDLALSGTRLVQIEGSGVWVKPERIASSRQMNRGVLWADDLHRNGVTATWRFGHGRNGGIGGSDPFVYGDVRSLRGQHRSFSDGSVRWVPAKELTPSLLEGLFEASATYHLDGMLWWF